MEYSLIFDEKELLKLISHCSFALKHVINQTRELCLAAVRQDGLALQYIRKQTHEICLEAVKQNGLALQYVHKQTKEICLTAVKQNRYALMFVNVENPDIYPDICVEALKQDIWTSIYLQDKEVWERLNPSFK